MNTVREKRPGIYQRKVVPRFDEIRELRRSGQTEKNLSKILGISYSTLLKYKEKYPEFAELLDDAKGALIKELETTMFEMALGKRQLREVRTFTTQNGDKQNVKIEETVKDIPPSVPLLIFSLKNLDSSKWRDVPQSSVNEIQAALDNIKKVSSELARNLTEDDDDDGNYE